MGAVEQTFERAMADVVTRALEAQIEPLLSRLQRAAEGIAKAQTEADPLFSRKEAAKHLNVAPITMAMWATEGRGPSYIRLGTSSNSAVRYHRSTLDAWLRANTRHVGQKGRPALAVGDSSRRKRRAVKRSPQTASA